MEEIMILKFNFGVFIAAIFLFMSFQGNAIQNDNKTDSISKIAGLPEEEPMDEEVTEQNQATQEPAARALTAEEENEIASFVETSTFSKNDRDAILAKYDFVDPDGIVPERLLEDALVYYDVNLNRFNNKSVITIVDYSPHSRNERLFVIDMKQGSVWKLHVAHGSGSDPDRTGFAKKFSNQSGSNMSSLGFARTAETYEGNHGYSLRLDGLVSTNTNLRKRAVVIHGAKYVWDQKVKQGRSWGCPAISMRSYTKLINVIKGGSLLYLSKSGR